MRIGQRLRVSFTRMRRGTRALRRATISLRLWRLQLWRRGVFCGRRQGAFAAVRAWRGRREFAAVVAPAADAAPAFVPVAISAPDLPTSDAVCTAAGRMEIVLGNGRRVIVDNSVRAAALARVIKVLDR